MATKRKRRGKFDDCRDCAHLETHKCVRCQAGEFFDERDDTPDTLDFFARSGSYDND